MVAAKDNIDTKLVALITLVSVIFLVLCIVATDAAYSWSESLVARGKEAGASTEMKKARVSWQKSTTADPEWADILDPDNTSLPKKKFVVIPLEDAIELTIKDRGK